MHAQSRKARMGQHHQIPGARGKTSGEEGAFLPAQLFAGDHQDLRAGIELLGLCRDLLQQMVGHKDGGLAH
ncbi:hypothetical protein, partial [Thermosporothrix hazakensis]|uniref:hypothetical protein n=1 Tax=Thermosporothrix hazakensis TaxID=644383 RepID=UPI001B86A772